MIDYDKKYRINNKRKDKRIIYSELRPASL